MASEKTILVKAINLAWRPGTEIDAAMVELEISADDEVEITIRKVEKRKLRRWTFTETGEEPRRIHPQEAYVDLLHASTMCCIWPGEGDTGTEYIPAVLVESEVDA